MPVDKTADGSIPLPSANIFNVMQTIIIPHDPTLQTHWSDDEGESKFKLLDRTALSNWVAYVLWESTTEFMVTHGMPTTADVKCWVRWLRERPDEPTEEIQNAIEYCVDYLLVDD